MFDPLRAVICGFENSGTTLVEAVVRCHPEFDSGFEGGFLLGRSPRDFPTIQPHFAFFRTCWELSEQDAAWICDTDLWAEAYRRARERSPVIANKQTYLFDKTPAYMRQLTEVLERVPGLPCVVTVRDPRALLASWAKRTGYDRNPQLWAVKQLPGLCERYITYGRGYAEAARRFPERLLLVRFEHLCTDPPGEFERIFRFLGLEFEASYLDFPTTYGVHGTTISTSYREAHRECFSAGICEEILQRTQEFRDWHYCARPGAVRRARSRRPPREARRCPPRPCPAAGRPLTRWSRTSRSP